MKRNLSFRQRRGAGKQIQRYCTVTFSDIWPYSGQQECSVWEVGRDAGADSLPGAGYRTHARMAACCGRTHPADEKAGTTASASQVRETNSGKQKKWCCLPLFCLLLSKIIMIMYYKNLLKHIILSACQSCLSFLKVLKWELAMWYQLPINPVCSLHESYRGINCTYKYVFCVHKHHR